MKVNLFKKIVCIVIAIMMLIPSMPFNLVNADVNPENTGEVTMTASPNKGYNLQDYPGYGSQGHVRMTKSAKWINKEEGIADITFNVSGTPVKQGIDAILLIDRSGSMGGGEFKIDSICVNPEHRNEYCGGTISWVNSGSSWEVRSTFLGIGTITQYQNKIGTCTNCNKSYEFTSERSRSVSWFSDGNWSSWTTPQPNICEYNHLDSDGNIITEGSTNCIMADTRLEVAQQAAKNFINTMFESEPDGTDSPHRVGLISFNSGVSNSYNSDLAYSSGGSSLNTTINRLVANGGTNYDAALNSAISMLNSRTGAERKRPAYIVFMTDGKPDPSNLTGSTQADILKGNSYDAKIYSIGLTMSEIYYNNLEYIASNPDDKYFYPVTDPGTLGAVYTTIANQVKVAGTNAKLMDLINTNYFDGNIISAQASTGETSVTTNSSGKVDWNIGDITKGGASLTIRVKLKHNKLSERGLIETNNGTASITYTNFRGTDCIQSVESPQIPRYVCSVNVEYYLVNDNGEPISKDNSIGEVEWKNREVLKNYVYSDNDGNKLLKPNVPYSINAEKPIFIDKNGNVYTYIENSAGKNGNPTTLSSPVQVTLTEDGQSKNIYFGYKKTENVTVTFDKNHTDETGWTDSNPTTIEIAKYTTLESNMPTEPIRYGYRFIGWSTTKENGVLFNQKTSITSNLTLYAQWQKDESKWHKVMFVEGGHGTLTGQKIFTNILNGTKWGDVVTVPTVVADKGYKFKGWNHEFPQTITGNSEFTAMWEKESKYKLTITYIYSGGANVTFSDKRDNPKIVEINAGHSFYEKSPELPGFIADPLEIDIKNMDSDKEIKVYYKPAISELKNNSMYYNKIVQPINRGATNFNIIKNIDYTFGLELLLGNKDLNFDIEIQGDLLLNNFKLYDEDNKEITNGIVITSTSANKYNIKFNSSNDNLVENKIYTINYNTVSNSEITSSLTVKYDIYKLKLSGGAEKINIKVEKMLPLE